MYILAKFDMSALNRTSNDLFNYSRNMQREQSYNTSDLTAYININEAELYNK